MNTTIQKLQKASDIMSDAYNYLHAHPQLGYNEWEAHGYLKNAFLRLGYKVEEFGDITGFTAVFDTNKQGKTVALFCELDGMINYSHPDSDKSTGAVHACGHDFQCASLLGVAWALKNLDTSNLSGKVKFIICPAEEGVDILSRYQLIKDGVIKYTSGKPELISRGVLDDVDIGYQNHIGTGIKGIKIAKGANGLIRKGVTVTGKASHAGNNPNDGVNALYGANNILSAINALRETFLEEDHIRVHPIITKGGDGVNTIPNQVKIESYVRGATLDAIKGANYKVNRAIAGGALAIGAKVQVLDLTGSSPLKNSQQLARIACDMAKFVYGDSAICYEGWDGCSSDMGDISAIIPTVMSWVEGGEGSLHGEDFVINNPTDACLKSATQQYLLVNELLKDDCKRAKEVIKTTPVTFATTKEYLDFIDGYYLDRELIDYSNGIKINLQ